MSSSCDARIATVLDALLFPFPGLPLSWVISRRPRRENAYVVRAVRRGPLDEQTVIGAFHVDEEAAVWTVTPERSPEGDLVRAAARLTVEEFFPTAALPPADRMRFDISEVERDSEDPFVGVYRLTSVLDPTFVVRARATASQAGGLWSFEISREGHSASTWFETALIRKADKDLGTVHYEWWSLYNGIGDDSRVLARASLFAGGDVIWHRHPALQPDSSTDHGEVLLCLAEHVAVRVGG